jgi:hypothetical protein
VVVVKKGMEKGVVLAATCMCESSSSVKHFSFLVEDDGEWRPREN